ncbi:unnamed protein product [Rangifer tarandus platyrhynchus]|uniref:Uncharacterized protein n=1 Tax=Rangifer tarandus platyrhynchus TaxID=3082113 RepID=A0AC59YPB3_RANTA
MFSKLLVTRKMPIKAMMDARFGSTYIRTMMEELDFPACPVVGSLPSSIGDVGSMPDLETEILHASREVTPRTATPEPPRHSSDPMQPDKYLIKHKHRGISLHMDQGHHNTKKTIPSIMRTSRKWNLPTVLVGMKIVQSPLEKSASFLRS